MKQAYNDVYEFMRIAGQLPAPGTAILVPTAPGAREAALTRLRFISSEFAELIEALQKGDVVETADALADLCYVVIGTAITFGIPLPEVWAEVQRSNINKFPQCEDCAGVGHYAYGALIPGEPEHTPENSKCTVCDGRGRVALTDGHGKVVKPAGWTPPDVAGVLARCTKERK